MQKKALFVRPIEERFEAQNRRVRSYLELRKSPCAYLYLVNTEMAELSDQSNRYMFEALTSIFAEEHQIHCLGLQSAHYSFDLSIGK